MTAQQPGQAEQDRAALIAWAEANDYTHQDTYEMADMDGAFMSGMQAARDLAAQDRPAPGGNERRALLDIIAEVEGLDEPGPAADYIRMLAEYGLGEGSHPDGDAKEQPASGGCDCGESPCARQDGKPAPELAAAMREARGYREALMRTREALVKATDDAQRRLRIAQSIITAALDGR